MTEEETKKEKDTTADETSTTEEYLNEHNKHFHVFCPHLSVLLNFIATQKKILPQFVSDLSTPPPDFF